MTENYEKKTKLPTRLKQNYDTITLQFYEYTHDCFTFSEQELSLNTI